jgi:hypothetical protein
MYLVVLIEWSGIVHIHHGVQLEQKARAFPEELGTYTKISVISTTTIPKYTVTNRIPEQINHKIFIFLFKINIFFVLGTQ